MVARRPSPRASSAPPSRPRPMYGPEPRKVVDAVEFTYWDRWILALAANTPEGWAGVRDALKGRHRPWGARSRGDTEAKLAQVDDLRKRLEKAGLTPRMVLCAEARDRKLLAKARTKVLDQDVPETEKTPAMKDTPRRRFERRALR